MGMSSRIKHRVYRGRQVVRDNSRCDARILGQGRIAMGSGEMERDADSARKGTRKDTQRVT